MSIKLVLDQDGLLTDFVKSICRLHNRLDPYVDSKNFGLFDMDKIWNIPTTEFWSRCNYDFWRTMDWMPDGKELLTLIESLIEPPDIRIVTAPCKTAGCREGKIDWVKEHMPEYSDRFIVDKDKAYYASPNHLLIDDRDSNIDKFHDAGGKAFLVPRPWNSAHMRQDGWMLQLERMILNANS